MRLQDYGNILFLLTFGFLLHGSQRRVQATTEEPCESALGLQNGWIEDASVTASSLKSLDTDPGRARLNGAGAWMPKSQLSSEMLQIHFENEATVKAVAVQGHPNNDYWVTQYALDFSDDGEVWRIHSQIMNGSADRNTVVKSQLSVSKRAHYMRIRPLNWHGATALRAEVYGCIKDFPPCGKRFSATQNVRNKRVVGGRESRPNSWPWQIELRFNMTEHYCGGAIIHPQWVVTAGHCFLRNKDPEKFEVRVGEHDTTRLEGYEQIMAIEKIVIHPGFVLGTLTYHGDNDIALLRLKKRIVFYDRVQPVCLPGEDYDLPIGKECVVTGFGKTSENSSYSPVLRETRVPIVSKEICNNSTSYNNTIDEQYFCAGYPQGGIDSCGGDSGGPFVCENEADKWVLTGLVEWGEGCARAHKYGVYLEVRHMLPFIESTLHGYPECGIRFPSSQISHQQRIVGGRQARPNSWPWMVELFILPPWNHSGHGCGGSLIGPSWVVSSAHCFIRHPLPSQWEVRIGEHNTTVKELFEEVIAIEKIHVHPGFDRKTGGDYDIVLLKLKRPAVFYKRVHAVCLPDEKTEFTAGHSCYITGWGRTTEGKNISNSEVLREVQVPLVSRDVCNSNMSYNGTVNERYICAGLPEGGIDSCQGDSGGPLVCPNDKGAYVLTGIVSWGKGCARPYKYGVYLDVKSVLPFVEGTVYGYPQCGVRNLPATVSRQKRVVGGSVAQPNSWPWMAGLLVNGTPQCGGSLINQNWIITSAHCFYTRKLPSNWKIRLGEHDQARREGSEQTIAVESIHIHPSFLMPNKTYLGDYDVALIKLKRAAVFYKKVHSVCLPDEDTTLREGELCRMTGWGSTRENGSYSTVLMEAEVPLVSRNTCNSPSSYNGNINSRYFCAGKSAGGIDACYGDSGGPLVCPASNGSFILKGIVSWGNGCARPHKFGVYLDVRKMLPFIESTLYGFKKCGIRYHPSKNSRQKRIVGGRESVPNSWPWQVDLLTVVNGSSNHNCGGSLIDRDWIVTSAHCFDSYNKTSNWEVRLGEHHETEHEGYEEIVEAERIFIHPRYVRVTHVNMTGDYDVALIKLKRPALFHKRVHAVCLPTADTNFTVGQSCYVTGWGRTSENSTYSKVLREVQVPLVDHMICNASNSGIIPKRYFCAGIPEGGIDACVGDSGGPLVCPNNAGAYVLIGIVTWGEGCARPNKYGVYNDVRQMLPFITSTIESNP